MTGRKLLVLAALAAVVLPAGGAVAAPGGPKGTQYIFRGHLLASPPANATSVSVAVEGGNRIALKKMLGASVDQNFAVGTGTVFLKWSHGIPTVVHANDLAAGDWVAVHVRAPRKATLSEIEGRAAGTVADRGPNPNPPGKPLFLFRGTLAAPAGASSVTLNMKGGNRNALRLLLGAPSQQSFTYGAETIFLLWQGRIPTVITPSQLTVGDRVTVRIRAAKGSTLGQVEATAANRVAEHEPANAKVVG